jgi:type II restriction enzyme
MGAKGTGSFAPTSSSDIDWSKSIAEIDEQLFDKYGLDEPERNFIRTKVKEMA